MLEFQVAQFLQQFCGINAVFSYAVTIFEVMRTGMMIMAMVVNVVVMKKKTKLMMQTIITMHRTQRLILTHMFATSSWPSLKSSSLQSQCSSLTGSPHLFLLAKTHFANSGLDGEFFWLLQSWSCAHALLPLVFTSTSSQRLRSKSHANIFICGLFAF